MCPLVPRSKASSNADDLVKTSGCRNERMAYSSCRLFCTGVPVSKSVCCLCTLDRTLCAAVSSFLTLCPSSRIMVRQYTFWDSVRLNVGLHAISYVVTATSYDATFMTTSLRRRCRSPSSVECSRTTRNLGHHFCNSSIHDDNTESGQMTRCGPSTPRISESAARKEMDWSVLPSPISSARMQLHPSSNIRTSHRIPSSWYSRSTALIDSGWLSTGTKIFSEGLYASETSSSLSRTFFSTNGAKALACLWR